QPVAEETRVVLRQKHLGKSTGERAVGDRSAAHPHEVVGRESPERECVVTAATPHIHVAHGVAAAPAVRSRAGTAMMRPAAVVTAAFSSCHVSSARIRAHGAASCSPVFAEGGRLPALAAGARATPAG